MFDLAVIGAGIVGAMAAYLARQQEAQWRILLLDRSLVGDGASKYSAGLGLPYGRSPKQKNLSILSERIFSDIRKIIPGLPIRDLPLFGLTAKDRLDEVIEGFTQKRVGVAATADVERLRDSFADLVISDDQALLAGCDCTLAAPGLVAGIIIDWLKRGGLTECWEGVEVRDVRASDGNFALDTTDGRTILSKRVLLAPGPWLLCGPGARFSHSAGVRIKKIVSLHIDRSPNPQDPVLFFFDEDAFLLPLHERREWLFSFTSQEWDCEPEISQLSISPADRQTAHTILQRYCPSFVDYSHGGRVFCDAYTTTRVPIIRQVPGMPNYVIAGACSGAGYRLAPATAFVALQQFS
jgi:glycine/D-amino acid oxidase-like deaminating enzyme